ncbi:hypothetical protein HY634_00355, partial [Candidatus Uhrbacteria bacterium]|nr:hypothetical protein [Candidatus Uhrbacteria bacterium]
MHRDLDETETITLDAVPRALFHRGEEFRPLALDGPLAVAVAGDSGPEPVLGVRAHVGLRTSRNGVPRLLKQATIRMPLPCSGGPLTSACGAVVGRVPGSLEPEGGVVPGPPGQLEIIWWICFSYFTRRQIPRITARMNTLGMLQYFSTSNDRATFGASSA